MKNTFNVFLSCLFCLILSDGSNAEPKDAEQKSTPSPAIAKAGQDRKAGERMVLEVKDMEYAFRWCPPGTFKMGSPRGESGRFRNETQHQVTLTQGFWMLETQVTRGMWKNIMGNDPSYNAMLDEDADYYKREENRSKQAVNHVSWDDCQEFIKKMNDLLKNTKDAPEGFTFSLPTEAQWEYACRAGTTTAFHTGDRLRKDQANFGNAGQKIVGSYSANAWGLYDMHGIVLEWCYDRSYDDSGWPWPADYPNGDATDPTWPSQPPQDGHRDLRVLRGGTYSAPSWCCRSAFRGSSHSQEQGHGPIFGVRLSLVRSE